MRPQQLAISLPPTEAEIDAEADRQTSLRDDVVMACRGVARELTYETCANALDAIWARHGRGVSASALRSALTDTERNHFRFEWVIWFAAQSEHVADLLNEIAGKGRPKKKPEDELRDLKELMRRRLGDVAKEIIRKAETP